MLSFFIRRPALPVGTVVNRGLAAFTPERWDGVVVADLGCEILVEWPTLGLVRERRRDLTTVVDVAESVTRDAYPTPRRSRLPALRPKLSGTPA